MTFDFGDEIPEDEMVDLADISTNDISDAEDWFEEHASDLFLGAAVGLGASVVFRDGQWVGITTGAPISQSVLLAESARYVEETQAMLRQLTRRLYVGTIDLTQWQTAALLEIKEASLAQAMLGAGGSVNLSPETLLRVSREVQRQADFLSNFAKQITSQTVSQAQALPRISQYGNVTGRAYWDEWQRNVDTTQTKYADLPKLTRLPHDGSTECRGNCRCWLEETEKGIEWVVNADERSCGSCVEMGANSPYAPM
jgi:plasmid maintenance system antidote protein VapI